MSTAVRSALSRSLHRRMEWHTYITSRRTCQEVYTISKDVRYSLESFIGTARREGRFGASSPHPASPSLVLSRYGRTDVMAMKDALGGWIGCNMARTHNAGHLRAEWPRHSASPPTPTAAAVITERR